MRPVERIQAFHRLIAPEHLTQVVDIGANPFAGRPPYGTFRRSDCCEVVGFEPLPEALEALRDKARHNDRFLPHAVGDGRPATLYVTKNSGLVSTLRPDPSIGELLGPWWSRATQVKDTVNIETRRLDDITEVPRVDFLKIDIQGGELAVFQNARAKLRTCAAIQTEVCFHPYYEGQPEFGEVSAELRAQGYIAHRIVETSAHPIDSRLRGLEQDHVAGSQLTVADFIFVKDPTQMDDHSDELIKHMALCSFAVFRSFDLCMRCIDVLSARGVMEGSRVDEARILIGASK